MKQSRVTLAVLVVLALAPSSAAQGVRSVVDVGEPIAVRTQVRHTTTVVVPMTETIADVVAGDAEYWDVSAAANVAYVKPLEPGTASNVTLVAESGHVWALLVSESGAADPDLVVHIDPPEADAGTLARLRPLLFTSGAALDAERREQRAAVAALHEVETDTAAAVAAEHAAHAAAARAWRGEYPGRVAFPYLLEDRARAEPFLVEALWHDGRFTYLRSRAQETPALYELLGGDPVLVAYELHDDGLYVADRVLGPGRLVIGELSTEWDDVRPRPPQPISRRKAGWITGGLFGGVMTASWWFTR